MRFFKGTAAQRAGSDKTGEAGDLVIESDTGKVAVADGTNTLGDLQLLARANEVTAAQAAAATDATTKANAAQSAAVTAAATDATTKAAAARAGAVTDVTTDISGGTGPVATALSASFAGTLIESGGTYPTRPDTDGAVLFIGTTDPAAFMEPQDIWANPAGAAPLDEAAAVTLLESGDSDLYDAVGAAVIEQALNTKWMNPENFISVNGAPTLLYIGASAYQRTRAWLLDATAVEVVSGIFTVPAGWSQMSVTLAWANQAAGAGNVRWRTGYFHLVENATADAADTFLSDMTETAAASCVLKRSTVPGSILVTPGERLRISVTRQANDAADTLANDVGLTGVLLTRLA